jgi:hypothetical protein
MLNIKCITKKYVFSLVYAKKFEFFKLLSF